MIVSRTETHCVKSSNPCFSMLLSFCHASKNLYNHANYLVRNEFFKTGLWLRYKDLNKLLRNDKAYPDYKNMPTAQSAQQILRLIDKNWVSFFKSIKDWSKNKHKYSGKPRPPKYLKKDSNYILILTNQNCKYNNGVISFPKIFNGFEIKPQFANKGNLKSFQQIRMIPHKDRIVIEVVYNIEIPDQKPDNKRVISIDLGVNNLAAVCNNMGYPAFIVNGKPLKSINQFYNKKISHYRSLCKRMNNKNYSNEMNRLTKKRNSKMNDYMHKASRFIVDYCVTNQINTIIIGKNKGWKQNVSMGNVVNQNFVQIPFNRFISMIQYKANEQGIAVVITEESYTSGTSFIDNEKPTRAKYNKARRVKRGLFISNKGISINADLNGAYQIMKKVFPIKWDSGCALHPVVVNLNS